jgi:ubiquinone/menaquinone biosynthesis C-methylase UbiE
VSELQHPDARSFEQVAEQYERTRPTYPAEALSWMAERLGISAGARVLDLGAGTGKLTRAWVERGAHVVAVEPGAEMLARLRRALPEVEALLAGAESMPIPDGSIDAVTCGQSFHWFRANEALDEFVRILRPGGGVGLIWNMRAQADEFQSEVTALLDPLVPSSRRVGGSRTDVIEADSRFSTLERFTTAFAQELDVDAVVDRLGSTSFVAAASASDRRRFEDDLRAAVERRGGRVEFRYVTDAYVTHVA